MYDSIWQAVKAELSGEKAKDFTARLWTHARWNTFSEMDRTAGEIARSWGRSAWKASRSSATRPTA